MKNLIFVLLISFLVFGCTQQTPETSDEVTATATTEQEYSKTEEISDTPPFDLATYIESGLPIKCDIETYEDGITKRMVLYIKGYKLRAHDYLSPDGSERLALIMNGTDMYVPQVESPECDWLKISSKDGDSSTGATNVSIIDTPVTNYSCVEDVFGDEKFDTPGKICDFWEIISEN